MRHHGRGHARGDRAEDHLGLTAAGMDSVATFPFKIETSQNALWGFWPETGKLVVRDPNRGGNSLTNQMGGPEIIFELNEMIDHPTWQQTWMEYCISRGGGRLAAYAYLKTKDPQWAQRSMGTVTNAGGRGIRRFVDLVRIEGFEALKPLASQNLPEAAVHSVAEKLVTCPAPGGSMYGAAQSSEEIPAVHM
jgi:hypothetical protein